MAVAKPGKGQLQTARASRTAAAEHSLSEIQRRFQIAIMEGDESILEIIPDNSRTSRSVLLGVYRHAYLSRLVDIVRSDHPILAAYLGDDTFAEMVRAYVTKCPSRHPNARWISQRLPEFLQTSRDYGAHPEAAELAQIERALNTAFDAKEAPLLSLADIARHPAEQWGNLCFAAHPSAVRLELSTNAFTIWQALKNDQVPPPAATLPKPVHLIIWRNGTVPSVRAFGAEESMMWNEAARGVRFSVLCELAATYDDPEGAALRTAQYLQSWIAAGMLSRARLAAKSRRKQKQALL